MGGMNVWGRPQGPRKEGTGNRERNCVIPSVSEGPNVMASWLAEPR